MKMFWARDLVTGELFEYPEGKEVCYLQNDAGETERIICNSRNEAFEIAVKRNRMPQRTDIEWHFQNWKAYDDRGRLIVGVAVIK